MFRAALRIKTAKAATRSYCIIIGEPLFNVADITFLFVTSGKTLETDISAKKNIRLSEDRWTGGGAFDH